MLYEEMLPLPLIIDEADQVRSISLELTAVARRFVGAVGAPCFAARTLKSEEISGDGFIAA
jgi:hypothetical protein